MSNNKEYIYTYRGWNFKLSIPDYWYLIYKGKPQEILYSSYSVLLDKLSQTISKDKIVLDIGVNHGIFSVPASLMGYKILGFEPVLQNFVSICEAHILNDLKDFDIYNYALSDKNEEVEIYVPECTDNASLNKEAAISNMKNKNFETQKVKAITFDSFLKENPQYSNIGFIKIDVQGAEYSIFEGMKDFLSNANDITIVCEYEEHLVKMGHTFEELDNLLISFGFVDNGYIIGNDKLFIKK